MVCPQFLTCLSHSSIQQKKTGKSVMKCGSLHAFNQNSDLLNKTRHGQHYMTDRFVRACSIHNNYCLFAISIATKCILFQIFFVIHIAIQNSPFSVILQSNTDNSKMADEEVKNVGKIMFFAFLLTFVINYCSNK